MPSEVDRLQFETIGRPAMAPFSFPQKRSPPSDAGRGPPSLLNRMSLEGDVSSEANATTHADTNLTRSPKAARQQKQRNRNESQAALASRISAPDTPALLNRISAPETQPRTIEARVAPPTKKKGLSGDSERPSRGAEAETLPLSAAPPNTENDSSIPALTQNSLIRKTSPTNFITAQSPPKTAAEVIPAPAHPTPIQIDSPVNPPVKSPRTSMASSSTALTAAVHKSVIGTMQPSSSNSNDIPDVQSPPVLSSPVLPRPRKDVPAEPEVPLPPVVVSVTQAPPSAALSSISTVSLSSSRAPKVFTAPIDPPSQDQASMAPSAQPNTPVSSPTKVTQDMIAFYLKPLWAESAAQMREWAEVANEREETQKQAQKEKSIGTVVNNNNSDDKDKETDETASHDIRRKRSRQDSESGEVGTDIRAKRPKLSVGHHPVAPSITPPPATPPTLSPAQAEAQAQLVVVEERTTIADSSDNEGTTKVVEQRDDAVSTLTADQPASLVTDRTTTRDGNDDVQAQTQLSSTGTRQVGEDAVRGDLSSHSSTGLPSRPEDATLRAHQQHATPELQEQTTIAAEPSPAAEAIDEAAIIRRRNLEQELAFHQREEQERKRQLEAERAKIEAAERLLKEREDELRKAMKKRKMEKAEAQVATSASPTVPVQVSVPVAAPVAASVPTPVSSLVVTQISPPRVPHPLPPKPQPLSGGVALGTIPSGNIVPMASPQVHVPSVSHNTIPKAGRVVSGSSSSAQVAEPPVSSNTGPKDVAAPKAPLLPVSIPPRVASHQVSVVVKKEEPRTPSIPRAAPSIVAPAKVFGPSSLKNVSKPEPSPQAPSRISPESQANSSSAKGSPGSPRLLIKHEPSSDRQLEPETGVNLGKRPRSLSLPAVEPPVIKKRRETSPPAADLELTYPDGSSETSGWGQVDVEQDDEERRPGGRRRVRTRSPEGSEGRGRGRTPVRWQRSLSRSRSRSPLRPTRGRGLPPSRGPRGRGAWNARGRPVEGYERRFIPRSPSPRRPARSRSPVGPRSLYHHYSPPSRRGRGPELGGAGGYSTSQQSYNPSADRWATHPHTHAPQPGPRFGPSETEQRRSPPRESDSLPRRLIAEPSAIRSQNTGPPIPRSRSPLREPHGYLAPRAPPVGPSADRVQNTEPLRHPPTSSLLRPRSPPHETYPQRRVPPGEPSAPRSQHFRPTSPPQLLRTRSPQRPPSHLLRRSPPVAQFGVRSQHVNQPPLNRTGRFAQEGPLDGPRNDGTLSPEQNAQVPSRGRGVNRPMSNRTSTDSQRGSRRFHPYSPTRRASGHEHTAVANTSEGSSYPQQSLSLRDRISPDNQPDAHRAQEESSRGNSQRGRGGSGPSRGGRGTRIKLSDRLSDGGSLAGRVGEPQ